MEVDAKARLLREHVARLGSVMVAYSGGTDSAYLAFEASRALGDRMLAVIADSPSLPRRELAAALAFAAQHGIPVKVVATEEAANPDYVRNDAQRCFHCKSELFAVMDRLRSTLGFAHLAYGRNVDDGADFRPGQQAAAEHRVLAPLADAGLTKADIRALARAAGLELADKPASACLASRVEYGRAVTPETLAQVERAEDALHALGFAQVRVRHHGSVARVEIAQDELARALDANTLARMHAAIREAGFAYAALDMLGYRSGSMNDLLPLNAIAAATTR